MVNKPLMRPCFWGGYVRGGLVDQLEMPKVHLWATELLQTRSFENLSQ